MSSPYLLTFNSKLKFIRDGDWGGYDKTRARGREIANYTVKLHAEVIEGNDSAFEHAAARGLAAFRAGWAHKKLRLPEMQSDARDHLLSRS